MMSKKTTCRHLDLAPTLGRIRGFKCKAPECGRIFRTCRATSQGVVVQDSAVDTTAVLHSLVDRLRRLERHTEAMDLVLADLGYSICTTPDCLTYFPKDEGNLVEDLPYCDQCYPKRHGQFMAGIIRREDEKSVQPETTPKETLAKCRGCQGTFVASRMVYHDAWEHLCEKCHAIVSHKEWKPPAPTPQVFQLHLESYKEGQQALLESKGLIACATFGCRGTFPENGGNEIDGKRLCDACYEKEIDNVECRSAPVWAWDIIDNLLEEVSEKHPEQLEDALRRDIRRAVDAMTVETAWNSNVAGKE